MSEPTPTADQSHAGATAARVPARVPTRAERVRALAGKYAWIPFSSDDYIREKRKELEREER